MKYLWKGASALALFATVAFASAPGCVEAEAPLFIVSAKVRDCGTITTDSDFLFGGVMDVRYSCSYEAVVELRNQLVRRGNATKLQLETSRISITRFDVEILDAAENPIQNATGPAAFTFPSTGFVDPGTGTEPGRGLAGVLLVDGATAQTLAESGGGLIIARVVAYGRTLGGDEIKTRPWDFPIQVCDGCLCQTPAGEACSGPEANAPEAECFIPQDFLFDCRFIGHDCSDKAVCGTFTGP